MFMVAKNILVEKMSYEVDYLGIVSHGTSIRIPVGVGRTFKSGMDMTYWYDLSTRNWYFISIVQLFIFVIWKL